MYAPLLRWSESHRHLLRQPTVIIQMEYGGNPDEEDESYEHNALDKIFQVSRPH